MKPFKPPRALATNILIGVCVVVQAVVTVGGARLGERLAFSWGLIPARIVAAIAGRTDTLPAISTLITHQFLHGGWLHLGLNILFLAWVGRYVEWVVGHKGLVALFITGGIVGGVAQILSSPHSGMPVVGASGAIAAVFGAYAMMFAGSRVGDRRVLGIAISGDTLTSLWYLAAWIGLQLLTGLVFNSGGGSIAIWAHIGGFFTGLVAARLWGRAPAALHGEDRR